MLGNPGSGKSTVSRYIVDYIVQQQNGWSANYINDYSLLYEKFRADFHHKRFHKTVHNGFLVYDLSLYDEVLREIELNFQSSSGYIGLTVIEFARYNYRDALKNFSRDFISSAYFLFLDVDIKVCRKRVRERVKSHELGDDTGDDHYVSNEVLRSYIDEINQQYLAHDFKVEYEIPDDKVKIIRNEGSLLDITGEVNGFIDLIFQQEAIPSPPPRNRTNK